MMDLSGKHIPDNRELFTFLSGEQMGIPHGHSDVLMAHEFLQLHECDLAGLCQPRCEGVPHRMQCDGIQAVAVFRGQSEFSDGGLETGGRFLKRHLFAGLLEDGFRWLAPVCLEHPDHIFRHTDEDTLAPFLDDMEAAGVGVHILPAQFENLRGPEAGSQREQSHVVQLRMPLFKVVQQGPGFLSGQETQSFIVGRYHFPCAASGGQGVDAAPHAGGDSAVYGGTHERKDIVHSLSGQCFPLPCSGFGISCGLFGLCISGRRLQELRLEGGKQIGSQFDHGQCVNFVLEMRLVLAIMLADVLSFAFAPCKIGVHQVSDGDLFPFDGGDACNGNLREEFCALFLNQSWTDALAVPADSFPVAFALDVLVTETVDTIRQAGSRITFGGLAVENALEFCFYVFSAGYVVHGNMITANYSNWKMIIHSLSKMYFPESFSNDNIFDLLIILAIILATCEGQRERERLVPRKKDQVPVKKSAFRLNKRAPDQPCLFRRNDYTSSYANGDFVVRSSTSAYPFGGALVSTGMLKPKWQAEAPLASLKAAP